MAPQNLNNLKIIIVDDNDTFRNGLKMLLEKKYNYQVIAEAPNAKEFLKLNEIGIADIVLMDIVMPDMDGIECTKHALWQYPSLKIIAITMHNDKAYLNDLIGAGFKACIFKTTLFKVVENAINLVIDGKMYFPEEIK